MALELFGSFLLLDLRAYNGENRNNVLLLIKSCDYRSICEPSASLLDRLRGGCILFPSQSVLLIIVTSLLTSSSNESKNWSTTISPS